MGDPPGVYDYVEKTDLSEGYHSEFKKKTGGNRNHAFFKDN